MLLSSGEELKADLIVTATGFTLQVMGGAAAWAVKTAEAVKTDDR